jgi:very-short-patch-repair endonuclease
MIRDVGAALPCESLLEVKVARLLRRAGVPPPVRQYEIGRYRVDFAWLDRQVVLECDGERYHTNFQRDRTKWSAIAEAGYRVLVVTWSDVSHRGLEIERQVRAALSYAA